MIDEIPDHIKERFQSSFVHRLRWIEQNFMVSPEWDRAVYVRNDRHRAHLTLAGWESLCTDYSEHWHLAKKINEEHLRDIP